MFWVNILWGTVYSVCCCAAVSVPCKRACVNIQENEKCCLSVF